MTIRPEIETAWAQNRDLNQSERLSFGLDEMALNVRHWLKWTKEMRAKEGLGIGEYADVHFPIRPGYTQFERWAETLEGAAAEMRRMRAAEAGWRTVDTAPKGKPVQVCAVSKDHHWLPFTATLEYDRWTRPASRDGLPFVPTHWRELPETPHS